MSTNIVIERGERDYKSVTEIPSNRDKERSQRHIIEGRRQRCMVRGQLMDREGGTQLAGERERERERARN